MEEVITSADSSSRLHGRETEIEILSRAIENVSEGFGRAVFLSGEAGIGKTRLACEAIQIASAHGFRVLKGRSFPLDGRLAYSQFLSAFGPFLRRLTSTERDRLVHDLPDLGRLFPGMRLRHPEPLGDPALEKSRLFEAVTLMVERLTDESSVLIFFDDLHWADPASIDLLQFLAHGLSEQPLLLLGTYRTTEIDSARGLRSLVTSLRRAGLSQELAVERLDDESVGRIAGDILGNTASPELLSFIESRSGGTPLFVEELIGGLTDAALLTKEDTGWTLKEYVPTVLPPGIRDLIHERLARLDETERAVADLVAVSGEAAPHAVLRTTSGLGDERLLISLRCLQELGLTEEEINGGEVCYRFTHPLIQDVAYAELSEMSRRRLHAAFANALDASASDDLDYRAYHFRLAGKLVDQDRALDAFVLAAHRAYELYANDQAALNITAALNLIREGRRPELMPALLERLGDCWERAGEIAAAISVWHDALSEFRSVGDAMACAGLHRKLAIAEWDRGGFDEARAHLDFGIEALTGIEPSRVLADLLHTRNVILSRSGDYERVLERAEQLEDLADRLGSDRVRAEVHLAREGWHGLQWEFEQAYAEGLRGLEAAERSEDSLLMLRCHDMLGQTMFATGDHDRLRFHADQSLALARRIGSRTLEPYPRNRLVMADLLSGNWYEAQLAASSLVAMARRIEFGRAIAGACSVAALVQVYFGDLEAADTLIREAYDVFGRRHLQDQHISGQILLAQLECALEREDVDEIRSTLSTVQNLTEEAGFRVPIFWASIGMACTCIGELDAAERITDRLVRKAPAGNSYLPALGARIEASKFFRQGDPGKALEQVNRAIQGFADSNKPFDEARALLDRASVLIDIDIETARQSAEQSLAIFDRLGASLYVDRSSDVLGQLGVSRPRVARAKPRVNLSSRELEVSRFVADGLTNAEIAHQLFISPRTVTTHLDRIYTRLDIHSRAELVRYLAEFDLLPVSKTA